MYQAYSDETFEFFMAIAFNNNADFFHANHDWYVRGVRGPSLYLAQCLSDTIEEIDDSLERRPDRVVSRLSVAGMAAFRRRRSQIRTSCLLFRHIHRSCGLGHGHIHAQQAAVQRLAAGSAEGARKDRAVA